jgi:hypothetical protein
MHHRRRTDNGFMLGQPPLASRASSSIDKAGWLPLATGRVVSSLAGVSCGLIGLAVFVALGHSLFLGAVRMLMGLGPVFVILILASPRLMRRQVERSILLAAPPNKAQRASTLRVFVRDAASLGGPQAIAVLLANPFLIGMVIGASLAMLATLRDVADWEASNRQTLVSLPSPHFFFPPRVGRWPGAASKTWE